MYLSVTGLFPLLLAAVVHVPVCVQGIAVASAGERVRVMINLLQKRHSGPYARRASSNSARFPSRVCARPFSACQFLATVIITRADA